MHLAPHKQFLEECVIPLRLACHTQAGWPIVLSLWYLYQDGALLCATQSNAKVVGYLQNDARCGFEIAADQPPYCGLRGRAVAAITADGAGDLLGQLLERYTGDRENMLAKKLLKRASSEVLIRLQPTSVHHWNFAHRMQSAGAVGAQKPCP